MFRISGFLGQALYTILLTFQLQEKTAVFDPKTALISNFLFHMTVII